MTLPATTRIHYDDPFLLSFDARVIAHASHASRPSVVLDTTAFYPESGGQLGDLGALGGATVVDVQVDDAGVVHHVIEDLASAPAVGVQTHGTIDRARRRLHMALHTGQHMLSRALLDVARAETVSSRLGASLSTVDIDVAKIDEAELARAEALVNAVIEDDVGVRQYFPSAEELPTLPLRRPSKVSENVRVVSIGDFDVSPCGGTHCTRSAQVGSLTITNVERYKGKIRLSFLAGRSAFQELSQRSKLLQELGRTFTCGPMEVRAAVEKLRRDLSEHRDALGVVRDRWARSFAQELLAARTGAAPQRVICSLDGEPVETLRALAGPLTEARGTVCFLASRSSEGVQVLIARGPETDFDCGAWLKRAAAAHNGRGGGRADRAEGRLPSTVDWQTLAAE